MVYQTFKRQVGDMSSNNGMYILLCYLVIELLHKFNLFYNYNDRQFK